MGDKTDFWDSAAKFGGVMACGIFGSVFAPAMLSTLIDGWISEQMAENPVALSFSCVLAALAGAGVACSVAIPVLKKKHSKAASTIAEIKAENEELAEKVSWFEDDRRRKLDGFTDPELKAMIECYRAGIGHMDASWTSAPIEPTGGLARSRTDEVMGQLIARGVVTFRNSRRPDCYDYALSPEWRSFVADNVDSIEARLRANEKRPSEVLKDLTDRYLESYAE